MISPRVLFLLLFAVVLVVRLGHHSIVWVEEGYPAAAALAIRQGAWLYRDIWFDKPPGSAFLYLLWGAQTGWVLRLAGALYITLASYTAYRFAHSEWGRREGFLAAALLAFSLTFTVPSAALVLGPDLLLIVPHLMAVHYAWRGRPLLSGLWCGAGLLINTKAMFIAAVCAFWLYRHLPVFGLAVLTPQLALLPVAREYWQQVWIWGMAYSRDTFVLQPFREGLLRTANWLGFQSTAVVAAGWFLRQGPGRRRWLLWLAISFIAVAAGLRFFPRYYFHVLPIVVLLASRGLLLMPRRWGYAAALLLLIPLVRFGPRYYWHENWADLAMERASHQVAARLVGCRSLFVWGYRPDVYAISGCPPGSPYLDSQPLSGVMADRHLTSSTPSVPGDRRRLIESLPHYIVDGLGPYNPELAITRYPDLAAWLGQYEEIGRTPGAVIYRLTASNPAATKSGPSSSSETDFRPVIPSRLRGE